MIAVFKNGYRFGYPLAMDQTATLRFKIRRCSGSFAACS